jgi:hypothetical protein
MGATWLFTALSVPLLLVIPLLVALTMNQRFRGRNVFRALYFAPYVLGVAVVAVLWRYLLDAPARVAAGPAVHHQRHDHRLGEHVRAVFPHDPGWTGHRHRYGDLPDRRHRPHHLQLRRGLRDVRAPALPAGLSTLQNANAVRYDLLMVGAVIASVPVLVLYLAAQRYVVEGVSRAGLKG